MREEDTVCVGSDGLQYCKVLSLIHIFVLFCLCRLVKKVGTVEVLQVLFFLKKETAQPIWYYRHLVDALSLIHICSRSFLWKYSYIGRKNASEFRITQFAIVALVISTPQMCIRDRNYPTFDTLEKIMDVLGVTPNELLSGEWKYICLLYTSRCV